jgi:hypothetical protein
MLLSDRFQEASHVLQGLLVPLKGVLLLFRVFLRRPIKDACQWVCTSLLVAWEARGWDPNWAKCPMHGFQTVTKCAPLVLVMEACWQGQC